MECQICYTSFKNVNSCFKCNLQICIKCIKICLLSSSNDPQCPGCKVLFSRDFLCLLTSVSFVNKELKDHRENLLFDRSLSKLPMIQERITYYNESMTSLNTYKETIEKYYDNLEVPGIINKTIEQKKRYALMSVNNYMLTLKDYLNYKYNYHYHNELENNEIKPRTPELKFNKQYDSFVLKPIYIANTVAGSGPEEKKETVKGHCPMNDCRGFVIKGNKCGVCDTHICIECFKERKNAHKCNEEDVLSVSFIKKDCKACPKCHVNVHRIEGCSQMWCTICHTSFNYNTGEVDKSTVIHNPHYFAYLASNNKNIQPINGCVEYVQYDELFNIIKDEKDKIILFYRKSLEYLDRYYNRRDINYNIKRLIIGRDYLLNTISKEEYKIKIQRIEKAESKQKELKDINNTWARVSLDIITSFVRNKDRDREQLLIMFAENLKIANESIMKIGKCYNSSSILIKVE